MGERSSSMIDFPRLRSSSGSSWGYHSKNNVLTYPNEQKRSPRQIPLAYHSKRNDMSYNRTLSPGGRRLTNPARASDSFDPYYSQRHSGYASPRASTDRVIPISTQTYLNPPSTTSASASSTRLAPGYDAYSGRPRRSSMLENTRSGSSNPAPPRNRPTVVQGDVRPSSPPRRTAPDYYIQPASSKEPKPRQFEHKKVYSVDDGSAKLVADVDLSGAGDRHHRRRESGDRSGYNRSSGYDRGRKLYHPSGMSGKTLEDDNAFSYTDPASMYRDTEPRWRETRPRRGSVDRGGASRERPVSMIEPYADPRRSTRDVGPPPSQRGWDKIQDLGRSRSTRDPVQRSPSRGGRERDESRGRYNDSRDPYYIAPRKSSVDRSRTQAVHQDRPTERYDYDYDDRRESRHHERRLSASRHNKDRSVSRRGFGVRSDSTDRYGPRGSDDSFETRNRDAARDSGFADAQYSERERKYPHEQKHRGYEDHDRDSDRDRPRKDREASRDGYRERHHRRRESERDDKKDSDNSFSGAAKIAAGGLGAAATLFGLNREKGKKEEREREEREDSDRMRHREHERRHDDRRDRETVEPEKRRRGGGSNEDDTPAERQRADTDRGLGFAFEGSGEGPKAREATGEPAAPGAPYDLPPPQPPRPQPRAYDREQTSDRDSDRPDKNKPSQAHVSPAVNDADEDYRRRMEQVQRELGLPAQEHSSDSDPDRERRRREREARQAERQGRRMNGHSEAQNHYDQAAQPPPSGGLRSSFEDDASQAPSQSTWSSAPTNNGQQELRRRPSILDSSMDPGLMAQVIDNSQSEKRENRVRIVDPPSDEEDKKPKGILKKPTEKFPENPNAVREGVAPLKDAHKKGIPPGARWTKIDRRLVNPEALEKANERFEERQDFVIVLRVLTKEEIQKLADRTREIREAARAQEDKHERRASRRRARKDRDEYEDENSEDEYAPRKPKMLEAPSAPSQGGASSDADFIRSDRERRERAERESAYAPPSSSRDY